MRMLLCGVGILALGFGLTGSAVAGETFEEVSKKIAAAAEKVKSFSSKSKTVVEMKQEGFSMSSTTEGTYEMVRKGDAYLLRTETRTRSETSIMGKTTKTESTMLMIMDGEYSYTLTETDTVKVAQKRRIKDPQSHVDALKSWGDTADMKVLADASVDGQAVWVIEMTPKGGDQGRTVLSYHKESGQMIKMVSYTPDGKPMSTMTSTDIKVNERISPERFVFKAPPGVTVEEIG